MSADTKENDNSPERNGELSSHSEGELSPSQNENERSPRYVDNSGESDHRGYRSHRSGRSKRRRRYSDSDSSSGSDQNKSRNNRRRRYRSRSGDIYRSRRRYRHSHDRSSRQDRSSSIESNSRRSRRDTENPNKNPQRHARVELIPRGTGHYVPPAVRRQMEAQGVKNENTDMTEQRESWERLKKKINGQVNKVNTSNIKSIVVDLFSTANLIRGRGLFCRSLMRAQSLSSSFTPVYAALIAVINTKLPLIGELLLTRLVLQFRRAFKHEDKAKCISTVRFIAQLTNQRVAHEVLAFQVISLLLESPTDTSVEVAVAFMREVGAFLADIAPRVLNAVFDTLRSILHEADIDKRTQYMIEVLFKIRRDGFKDLQTIPEGLDLVEEEEQIVHEVALDDDDLDTQDELNVFNFDEDFKQNEIKYNNIRREIVGDSSSEEDSDGDSSGSGSSDDNGTDSDTESNEEEEEDKKKENEDEEKAHLAKTPAIQEIHDLTETEKVNLRRTIYLAIMSSLSYEEATHKLLKIEMREGEELELCNMVIECCSQERTYKAFYGLVGERLCKINKKWNTGFYQAFQECYNNIHRYETNHLRNIAHFCSHLLISDAISWSVLSVVTLTEESTTSSSRIFLKILLQDLSESLGLNTLNDRLKSDDGGATVTDALKGLFPNDNAKNLRFAINYYTSIGLGAITEEMREWLKEMPSLAVGDSDSDSDSSSGSGSSSDSDSSSSSGSYSSSSGSYSSSDSGSESD